MFNIISEELRINVGDYQIRSEWSYLKQLWVGDPCFRIFSTYVARFSYILSMGIIGSSFVYLLWMN